MLIERCPLGPRQRLLRQPQRESGLSWVCGLDIRRVTSRQLEWRWFGPAPLLPLGHLRDTRSDRLQES